MKTKPRMTAPTIATRIHFNLLNESRITLSMKKLPFGRGQRPEKERRSLPIPPATGKVDPVFGIRSSVFGNAATASCRLSEYRIPNTEHRYGPKALHML